MGVDENDFIADSFETVFVFAEEIFVEAAESMEFQASNDIFLAE